MSIFVDKNSRVVVQGITGREGQFHTRQCVAYGTRVVAGVTPGKAGQKMDDVPVFNTVQTAVAGTGSAGCAAAAGSRLQSHNPQANPEITRLLPIRRVTSFISSAFLWQW